MSLGEMKSVEGFGVNPVKASCHKGNQRLGRHRGNFLSVLESSMRYEPDLHLIFLCCSSGLPLPQSLVVCPDILE